MVLRRPFELARVTGHWELEDRHISGNDVNQDIASRKRYAS